MQRSGKGLHNALLFVLALALALGVRVAGAWGQEETSSAPNPDNIPAANSNSHNNAAAGDLAQAAPQPTGSALTGSAGKSAAVRIQAMKGAQILADSSDLKQMLKRMITSQVPVMYQTMMMVENGAATGFMGSMHTVSNMMDNTMQAASLELAIRAAAPDDYGADSRAFVDSMRQGLQQAQTSGKTYSNAWPAALLHASGDSFEKPDDTNQKLDQFVSNPAKGANPNLVVTGDGKVVEVGGGDGGNGGTPPDAGGPRTIVDIAYNKQFSGIEDNNTLKSEIKEFIGDMQIAVTPSAQNQIEAAPYAQLTFIEPTETGGPQSGAQLKGLALREYKNKLLIWDQWYNALKAYCDFKSQNPNSNPGDSFPGIFRKKKPSEKITTAMITGGSARDITMSVPLIDMLFKLFIVNSNHEDPTKLDCSTLIGEAKKTMPDKYVPPREGDSDDCKDDSAKTCLRNKVLYRLVEMIAVSRTVDDFKKWYLDLFIRTSKVNSYMQFQAANLVCQGLGEYRGSDLCDPFLLLDNRAALNRERWVRHVTELTKLAQFTGGASVFRGGFNNNSNFAANEGGFDSTANANPGGP